MPTANLEVATNPHPLSRFRVDGVVSELPEFARAFSCKPADPLARPEGERCQIW